MFTSITALRKSHAQQARVTTVASNLKKLNAAWQDDWYFPIVAIGLSNSVDDVSWVKSTQSVLLASSQKQLRSVRGNTTVTATELNQAARKHYPADLYSSNKAIKISDSLDQINKYLQVALVNADFDWTHGLTDDVAAELAPKADEVTGVQKAESISDFDEVADLSAETSPADERLAEAKAREAFAKVFPDVDLATSTNTKGVTKFANDRTQGKFVGFYAGLKALKAGDIAFSDIWATH